MVTPFKSNLEVDYDALEKVIDFVIRGGVEYIVTLGTTGETPTIDRSEKISIANFTFEKVNGRIPIVIGIGGNNTTELVRDLETFPVEKAVAVLSASPYYSKPSQEGLFRHFAKIADATRLPIILYSIPAPCGIEISVPGKQRFLYCAPLISPV